MYDIPSLPLGLPHLPYSIPLLVLNRGPKDQQEVHKQAREIEGDQFRANQSAILTHVRSGRYTRLKKV